MSEQKALAAANRQHPLVSVLIPCYNSGKFLPALFGSLMVQTYPNIEVIVVDDCSHDNSWEVANCLADQLRKKLARVELLKNASNLRPGRSLLRASKICEGELLSILDSDDYYHPERIEQCVRFLESHPDFGAVHSEGVFVRDDLPHQVGVWKSIGRQIPQGWVFDDLLVDDFVLAGSLMFRREYFFRCWNYTQYLARDYKMGDYPSLLNLSRLTKIGYIDEPLFFYREHKQSQSHSPYHGEMAAFLRSAQRVRQDARLGLLQPKPEPVGS